MDTSTVTRNILILKEVFSGKTYAECAKKFNMSLASVTTNIRSLLKHLKEHTDINVLEASSFSYVLEKKEEIEKYLDKPFPKTIITKNATAYLQQKFTKYFASHPEKVASHWDEVRDSFNRYRQWRDILSIQRWLASEGYLVGNVVTDAMLDFVFETLKKTLSSINACDEKYSLVVKKVERQTHYKTRAKAIVQAEIGEGKHRTTRQFSIELIA